MHTIANRLTTVSEYYFSTKLAEIGQLIAAGKPIINLGIGSPDLPPHPSVIKTLHTESAKLTTHSYQSYKGSLALREAISKWYATQYNVTLNGATEILPLMGSKEGIVHICMTYLNEGDKALIPNPGYPTYKAAVALAGGECVPYILSEENNWLPNINELQQQDVAKVKLLFINYPHMPSGASGSLPTFEKLIQFAKDNNIIIVNDNPYSFIRNDEPLSILQVPNASAVAIELNSLSKSHNMAGWRVGMLCSSEAHINNILRFKSNMDSGMYLPIQLAAATALALPQDWYTTQNEIYASREKIALQLLDALNCTYQANQQGLFIWAKVPSSYKDGYALSDWLLYGYHIFVTPGGVFGSAGNAYIRISLCQPEVILQNALTRIKKNITE